MTVATIGIICYVFDTEQITPHSVYEKNAVIYRKSERCKVKRLYMTLLSEWCLAA